MRIKCLAQGHYCRCQQIRTGDPHDWESMVLSTEPQQLLKYFHIFIILVTILSSLLCLFTQPSDRFSITPMMYPASFIFEESSLAYVCLIVINLFIGITTICGSFLVELFNLDDEVRRKKKEKKKSHFHNLNSLQHFFCCHIDTRCGFILYCITNWNWVKIHYWLFMPKFS